MTRTILATAALVVGLSGCATIFDGATQAVAVRSAPEAATFTITNRAGEKVHVGTTPSTVTLKRGAGYFKRMKERELYTTDNAAIVARVAKAGLSGALGSAVA